MIYAHSLGMWWVCLDVQWAVETARDKGENGHPAEVKGRDGQLALLCK